MYHVGKSFLIVGQGMTQCLTSARQVCIATWCRHALEGLARPKTGNGSHFLGHVGQILSQQNKLSQVFRHCRSLHIGTSTRPVPANRSHGHVPKLIMCHILETSNTRITSLHTTAVPLGHYCAEGIVIKCSSSFPLCSLDRGLYQLFCDCLSLSVTHTETNRNRKKPKEVKENIFKKHCFPETFRQWQLKWVAQPA